MNIRSLFFNDSINFKFLYDIPYIKQVIAFFLIPLLVFIIICSIILLAYSNKGVNDIKYKYKANVFSVIISILLTVVFFSILLGFSYAFYKQMTAVGLKTPLAYLVIASPIIPFIFLISFFIKLIKVMKQKPPKNIDSLEENNKKEEIKENIPEEKEEKTNAITEDEVVYAFKEEYKPEEPEEDNIENISTDAEDEIKSDVVDNNEESVVKENNDIESILEKLDNIDSDEVGEEPEFGKHEETGKHEKKEYEYGKHEEQRDDELDDILTDEVDSDDEIELL